jgi:hypothetical protein
MYVLLPYLRFILDGYYGKPERKTIAETCKGISGEERNLEEP